MHFCGCVGATENAGVENVAAECRGGNRRRNEYGEQKFPFFNIVVESSIALIYPSGLQQPIELI